MVWTYKRSIKRWVLIVSSFIIISLILWNTYVLFQNFKEEERNKMQLWSMVQREISNNLNSDNIDELAFKVITNNKTTPMIVRNFEGVLSMNNIPEDKHNDSLYIKNLITQFESENEPIVTYVDGKMFQTVYYGNSPVINKLKYYPLALMSIIVLFGAVVYFFYRSSRNAEKNRLWTGMAKETAHQIGTPLSSLVGWTEILKSENVNPSYISEIEKDISRLQIITERFSKIGSAPKLETHDIVTVTTDAFDYLKTRSSKLIDFNLNIPNSNILVALNTQLYSWTIENLVKNAIDAMKGKGKLNLNIIQKEKNVYIQVSDTGKGLSKSQFNSIFIPGYTTKKRGWGLGLSLAKRIIEEYHNGKIKVLKSEINKGTTMQITLKTV